ncbi:hypothetical protein [uncultured Campylobacter sp.]|uniref:hypothetical protein n=1 Tax=uncultured Campylobacter sp. TaxID=218934 RepID=UPI0026275531|nr:hypothetical protein [uncultured Campylobacter sp.]
MAGGEHSEEAKILCRIDLRALKVRRDLDADGVTRSLQGTKIYAKKQARATKRWTLVKRRLAASKYRVQLATGSRISSAADRGK